MNGFKSAIKNKNLLRALAVSLALSGTLVTTSNVLAQSTVSKEYDFNIPAQSLTQALNKFAMVTGLQVSAHSDVVRGLQANAVEGRMSAMEALLVLTNGLKLNVEAKPDGSVLFSKISATGAVLEPITINETLLNDRHSNGADRASSKYISGADLARRNPRSTKDVFAGEASVSVGGGVNSSQKVYVRAVEEHNLAVTIDGARQNNKVFHHSGNNLVDPALLKAVRVDPTVAPADAGPGAMAGALVYETVDVADVLAEGKNLGGFSTLSYDTDSETVLNANSIYARDNGFEVLGFVKWGKGDDYTGGNGEKTFGTGTDVRTFLGKTGYETTTGHRFELSGEYLSDEAKRPYRANLQDLTSRNEPKERTYHSERSNFAFNYNMKKADGWLDPRVTIGYGVSKVSVPEPFGSIGATRSFSGKIENDFNLDEKNKITAGVDFYFDTNSYKGNTQVHQEEEAKNFGTFVQARIEPLEKLRVSTGVRLDKQKFAGINGVGFSNDGVSGNGSVAYDVVEGTTLKAGYSNIFGGISLAEGYIFNGAWTYTEEVKPTRAENFTVGVSQVWNDFLFDFSVFRSDFDNARRANWRNGPHIKHDFETKGFEIGAKYRWKNGFARVNYSDTQIKIDGTYGNSDTSQYMGAPLGRIVAVEAEHTFEGTGLTLGGKIDGALKNKDTVKAGNAAIDGYATLGLFAEYKPENLEFMTFRIEGNNLMDKEYADRASYGQEFGVVKPAAEPGRSFLLSLRAEF